MIPEADYHMHTPLCGHASGEPCEYVEKAISLGLAQIGFSDHAPLVTHRDPSITMDFGQLPEYHRMIEEVRDRYRGRVDVKIGIEADFAPSHEADTKKILEAYPYDYVIGSVHYIAKWAFDNPIQMKTWDEKNNDEVYRDYFRILSASARSGMFDIIGHVDLVKKFGHRASDLLLEEVERTAEVFKETGSVIEINTSGLRKPVKEIYPSLDYLRVYARKGVPVTFGSDAHAPEEVGKDFEAAVELAKDAGYHEYMVLDKNGRLAERPLT